MNNKLLLIDGNSLVYRAYYGMASTPAGVMKNSQGLPVNSILVFAKMINRFLLKYQPTHLLVAFDAGKETDRHKEYPEYKANRPPMPEDLRVQLPLIKEMLDHMSIKHFERQGVEADDIIGTLSKASMPAAQVFILSSDKDMFQLIGEKVSVIYPQSGSKADLIYDLDSFVAKWGYQPSQVVDVKGLAGDSSDNLPGVKGVGNKGAVNLIKEYTSLEGIYKNINSISGVLQDKLVAGEAAARMSKHLATIMTSIDLGITFRSMKWSNSQIKPSLFAFFERIETRSLVKIFKQLTTEPKIASRIVF